MIRINLLAVERGKVKKRGGALIPAAHRVTIAASLILLGTALLVGWWFWSLRQTSQRLDQDIAKGEAETQRLRSVLAQVQKFESRKAQLQQRVSLIEQLRRGQNGPVHALDEISKALPERMWLTELLQKGDDFTLNGITTSQLTVSDFIANLGSTNWFKNLELIQSTVENSQKGKDTTELFKFSIKAVFNNPEAPPLPKATPLKGAKTPLKK
jgi:type IV pilus assembly protein PilN